MAAALRDAWPRCAVALSEPSAVNAAPIAANAAPSAARSGSTMARHGFWSGFWSRVPVAIPVPAPVPAPVPGSRYGWTERETEIGAGTDGNANERTAL